MLDLDENTIMTTALMEPMEAVHIQSASSSSDSGGGVPYSIGGEDDNNGDNDDDTNDNDNNGNDDADDADAADTPAPAGLGSSVSVSASAAPSKRPKRRSRRHRRAEAAARAAAAAAGGNEFVTTLSPTVTRARARAAAAVASAAAAAATSSETGPTGEMSKNQKKRLNRSLRAARRGDAILGGGSGGGGAHTPTTTTTTTTPMMMMTPATRASDDEKEEGEISESDDDFDTDESGHGQGVSLINAPLPSWSWSAAPAPARILSAGNFYGIYSSSSSTAPPLLFRPSSPLLHQHQYATAAAKHRPKKEKEKPYVYPCPASGGVPDPSANYLAQSLPPPPPPLPSPRPLLVVLDLNGTLLHRPRKSQPTVFKARPRARDFLRYCAFTFRLVVWSSAMPRNVKSMCDALFERDSAAACVAVWARDRFALAPEDYYARVQCYKRLTRIWNNPTIAASHPDAAAGGTWDQTNTVLVDDSVEKARAQPHNLLAIPEFIGDDGPFGTEVLPQVHDYLNLLAFQVDVSRYIRHHPFVLRPGLVPKSARSPIPEVPIA